jgi:hypothetical protein
MLDLLPLCPDFLSLEDKVNCGRKEGALTLLLRCRVRVAVTVGNGVGTNSGRSGGLMRALNLNPWHTRSFNRR